MTVKLPSLDALQAFLVFSETLNFTHAAEQLHISQPALHVKIQELSNSLEMPLYTKVGRRLELTEQGRMLARFSRKTIEQTKDFVSEISTGAKRQSLVFAAGEGAYLYLLGEPIKQFLQGSKANLKLLTLNRDGIIDAISTGKAQLGVASCESIPDGFQSHLLCKVEQVLVLPKKHPLLEKRKLRLRDLSRQRLIVPPADRPHRQVIAAALQSEGIEWEVSVEASGWEVMINFVKMGMGLAIVNSCCEIPSGLVMRSLKELPQIHYHLLHLKNEAKVGPAAELKQLLLSHNYATQEK